MCGRYRVTRSQKKLKESFNAYGEVDVFPRYNIAPSQAVITIRHEACKVVRNLSAMRWDRCFLGQGHVYRVQDDQRESRNSRHNSVVPGTLQVAALPGYSGELGHNTVACAPSRTPRQIVRGFGSRA